MDGYTARIQKRLVSLKRIIGELEELLDAEDDTRVPVNQTIINHIEDDLLKTKPLIDSAMRQLGYWVKKTRKGLKDGTA